MICELIGAAAAAALVTKVIRPDWGQDTENASPGIAAKLASEFLGTYILVLTVGLNVLAKSPAGAFSIAASLMVMIYSLGDVSGANFNPAVSLALLATKNLEAKDAAMYMGVQILGGITAAGTYTMIHQGESFALGPGKGFGLGEVAVAEIFFTFVLCFVVLSVAVSPAAKEGNYTEFFGLAIGSCVTVGGCAIGAISGGSLNPAVSFGIAFGDLFGSGNFTGIVKEALAYSIFEFIGAGLAVGVYMGTHAMGEKEKAEGAVA
jgi:aquaporin Z